MDSGRATVRNMRSKCRCSYVLQFTFRHAVCCVLHRPPSQVIHCIVLFIQKQLTRIGLFHKKQKKVDSSSRGGRATKKPRQGRRSLSGFVTIVRSTVHRTQSHGPPANTIRVEQISSELSVRNSVRPPADKPAAPEFPS